MKLNFSQLQSNNDQVYDYCIVGSGPAGMTTAIELSKTGKSVLMVEAGAEEPTMQSQTIYAGKTFGDPYFNLSISRLRYLGGTSGHWAGWCRPLDASDFQNKINLQDAHWPITKQHLAPFLQQASSILAISPVPADEIIDKDNGIKKINFSFSSPPVRFGHKFKTQITQSPNLHYVLNTNLTRIKTNGSTITQMQFEDYQNQQASVKAKVFILAAGGIENSRLLLWSQEQENGALVDQRAPLGGYWMEHPHFTIGEAIVSTHYTENSYYSLTAAAQQRLAILNCGLRLQALPSSATKKLLFDLACVTPAAGKWAAQQIGKKLFCGAKLRAAWEQEPSENNRISLSQTEKDRFGMPVVNLHWKKTAKDLETIQKTALQFGIHLTAQNLGRLRLDDWVYGNADYPHDGELAGHHHMGGTRMADSPSKGVVDANCKVYGQDNLYIAGSSVFPSSGHTNPTLTIIQLSLRLAEYLKNTQ